jgi:hypothetical protein
MTRKIMASLYRGKQKAHIWTRYYSYFDTAMPRAVQLALTYGEPGDIVEFSSTELGFQLGTLKVLPRSQYEVKMSPLVKASPSLLKLMNLTPKTRQEG